MSRQAMCLIEIPSKSLVTMTRLTKIISLVVYQEFKVANKEHRLLFPFHISCMEINGKSLLTKKSICYERNIFQIFETERIASNSFSWHRSCFSCVKCSSPLSATNKYNYEGPDGELYCKTCFKKSFPNTEAPKLFGDTSIIKPNEPENGCPRCGGAVFQVNAIRF